MVTATSFSWPQFKYGWLPEYFGNGSTRSFNLRSGQWVAINPRLAHVSNDTYLAHTSTSAGLSHLISNTGDLDTMIDISKRAGMDAGGFIIAQLGWNAIGWLSRTTPAPWTTEAINREVDAHLTPLNGKLTFFLDQIGEKLSTLHDENLYSGNGFGLGTWNASEQQKAWAKKVAEIVQASPRNGRFYGGYDGHLPNLGFRDEVPNALVSNEAAFNFAKITTPFGNDFYSDEGYKNRHGSIKIYQTGATNMHQFVVGMLLSLWVDRMARAHIRDVKGFDRRVAVVAFSGYMETLSDPPPAKQKSWSVRYSRTFPGGGTVARSTFPQWSYPLQLFLYTTALLWDFDLYSWESEERFGNKPEIIDPDYGKYTENGVVKGALEISSGANYDPGPAPTVRRYQADPNTKVTYPLNPQGGQDIVPISAELATWLKEWVGNWNTNFSPHQVKPTGSTQFGNYTSVTNVNTYVWERFNANNKQGEAICMTGTNGSNRRWVLFCDVSLKPGQIEQVRVDLGSNQTFEFTAFGQNCHAFQITIS